jgi:hypothetical protein
VQRGPGWEEELFADSLWGEEEVEDTATEVELAAQSSKQLASSMQAATSGQEWYEPEQSELPPPLPKGHPEVQRRVAMVEELLLGMQALAKGEIPQGCGTQLPVAEWEAKLREQILGLGDSERFQAGNPHRLYWVWHYFFGRAGELLGEKTLQRRQVRRVLQILRQGIKLDLVPATSPGQFESRTHQERLVRCCKELRHLVGEKQLAAYLDGPELLPVHFPNSLKLQQLEGGEQFLAETRDKLLAIGSLLPTGGKPPKLVHRLTPDTKKEKWRLCWDTVYCNVRSKVALFRQARGWIAHSSPGSVWAFGTNPNG